MPRKRRHSSAARDLTSPAPVLLDHGYDETKDASPWQADDIRQAAEFRGGRCHAGGSVAPDEAVEWECAVGHRFRTTPNLYLRGGHWCPTCMVDPATYPTQAERNPFFAQVWTEERSV